MKQICLYHTAKRKESKDSLKSSNYFLTNSFISSKIKFFIPLLISFLFKENPSDKQDILCHACGHFLSQSP